MPLRGLDLVRTAMRSLYIQATWNYQRMLSLGFCFALIPFARKRLKTTEERRLFLKRNLTFFNTNPYMAGWIIGAVLRMEDDALSNGESDLEQTQRFKTGMSQSLAAVGDQLFWERLRPLTALLGWLVSLYAGVAGVVVFFVTYNVPHLFLRFNGVVAGYRLGFNLSKENMSRKLRKGMDNLLYMGAVLTGLGLVAAVMSNFVGSSAQISGFAIGAVGMYLLLKMRIAVPVAVAMLLIIGLVIGGLLSNVGM